MIDTPVAEHALDVMTFAKAVNLGLEQAMAADDSVVVFGEDVTDPMGGVFTVTSGLSTRFGAARVLDTPISEQAIIGAAVGAAVAGMRPVAEIMLMDFLPVGIDQLVNHAAKLRYMSGGLTPVPLTLRAAVGGGRQMSAQHAQSLEAWLMHSPGIKVAFPSCAADAKGLITACIEDDDPCVFLESVRLVFEPGPVPTQPYRLPLGKADVKRPGSDVTLITWGWQVGEALAAADVLATEQIDVEVIDLRTLVPLDMTTVLECVAQTTRAFVVHAAVEFAGPGAEIAARIGHELFGSLSAPVERLGAPYAPAPFAEQLQNEYYPHRRQIVDRVRQMCGA